MPRGQQQAAMGGPMNTIIAGFIGLLVNRLSIFDILLSRNSSRRNFGARSRGFHPGGST